MKTMRQLGVLLLNLFVAVFGVAVMESPIQQLFRPLFRHSTIGEIFIRAYLTSAALGFVLGSFVYRRWKPSSAKWLGLVGAFWIGARIILILIEGQQTIWSALSGSGCLQDGSCIRSFMLTLVPLRLIAYSLGATYRSWTGKYGPSALEMALLARFPRPSAFDPAADVHRDTRGDT
jgi:hypothetical protein